MNITNHKKTTRKPRFWTTNGLPSMRDNSAAHFENPPFAERVARRTGAATHASNVCSTLLQAVLWGRTKKKTAKKRLQRIPKKVVESKRLMLQQRWDTLEPWAFFFHVGPASCNIDGGLELDFFHHFSQIPIQLNAWAFGFRVINAAIVANEGLVYGISLGCKRFATKCSMSYWTVNWGGAIKTNRNINPNDSISFVFTYVNPLNCPVL